MIIFDKKGTNHEVPVYIPGTWGFILVRFALTHLVCLYYFFMGTDIKMCQHVKSQRRHFADKGPYSQSFGFPSSHVWMWELDHKEGRVLKNWCFQTVVLEKTFESPLDCQEIKPVNPKRNQPWIFIGRTDAEAEAPILWPPDVKSCLTGKDFNAGKDWRQEKGTTEDETVGWHHQLNGHEFEQTLGDGEGQGSQACCNPWGRRVSYNLATEEQQHMEKEPVCCQRMELFHSARTAVPMKSGFWWHSLIS